MFQLINGGFCFIRIYLLTYIFITDDIYFNINGGGYIIKGNLAIIGKKL